MSVAAPPTSETQYRPVCGLAVWGLLLGLLSPLVFVIGKAWALLFFCLPGLFLSAWARRKVMNSNGALAGYIPATFGVVLSVACGLGWVTYDATKDWILESEARAFVMGWCAKLQAGKDCEAFIDCVEPIKRKIDFPLDARNLKLNFPPPEGTTVPQYDIFRYGKFTSMMLRYGPQVKLTPQGRPEIKETILRADRQQLLKFQYGVESPLGEGYVIFSCAAADVATPSGQRREWQVLDSQLTLKHPSDFSIQLDEAVQSAEFAFTKMAGQIARGDKAGLDRLFVSDQSQGDFPRICQTMWASAGSKGLAQFNVRKPLLLLKEERQGAAWKMQFRGQFENETREVEFEMEVATPSLAKEADGWRWSSCRLLGERKRMVVESPPMKMPQVKEIPEDFRLR